MYPLACASSADPRRVRRPSPCSRAASARPAGRRARSTGARGPGPRRRRRRRRRSRSRQREWAGVLGDRESGQGLSGSGKEGGKGARRPRQAARSGQPPCPTGSRDGLRVQPAFLRLSAHSADVGQGVRRWRLPGALSSPAALESWPLRSEPLAAGLQNGVGDRAGRAAREGQARSRLWLGAGSASEPPDSADEFHCMHFLFASRC